MKAPAASVPRRKLTLRDQVEILKGQAICPRCGEPLGRRKIQWDHFIPRATGLTAAEVRQLDRNDNMVALHVRCHADKTTGPITKTNNRGTDITELRRSDRLRAERQAHLLARQADSPDRQPDSPKRKREWPKRKFDARKVP